MGGGGRRREDICALRCEEEKGGGGEEDNLMAEKGIKRRSGRPRGPLTRIFLIRFFHRGRPLSTGDIFL